MAAVPVGAKLHRFAPTRELTADYESVVPANVRSGEKTRVLRQFLKQRDDESVTGTEEEHPILLPSVNSPSDAGCSEDSMLPWTSRLQGPLFRKIAVLRRALYLAGKESKEAEEGLGILVQSARESPSATASILSRHMLGAPQLQQSVSTGEVTCAEGGCSRRALPYSRYCLNHVSKDRDQILYGSCTASEASGVPCGSTVFDFLLNQQLCSKHITKAALENSTQQQKRKVVVTSRIIKAKSKGPKTKKTKATVKLVITKPPPASSSSSSSVPTTLPTTLTALSSTSSWSSGESDGGKPDTKRRKVAKPPPPDSKAADPHRLPSLTPEVLDDMSLSTAIPLPSLILPPPCPDIGKFMDDSSSEDS